MFFVFKKYDIFFAVAICICLMLTAVVSVIDRGENIPVFSVPASNKVIVIDAGHGGVDAGASANNTVEKELNLKIALKLKEYIEQSGGIAILTRDEDVSTQDTDSGKGTSAKQSDLKNRKDLVDESKADMFVSIHMNKFEQEKYKGAQVFYSNNSEESKKLGEIIQSSMREILDSENNREAKNSNGKIYVIKNANVPSVLIECGFLSNTEEAKKLSDDEYQQKVAWSIYMGITKYWLNIDDNCK